jgi:hypothetical protein
MFAPPDVTTLKQQADATLDAIAQLNGGDGPDAIQACAEATVFAELLAIRMKMHGIERFGGAFDAAIFVAADKLQRESKIAR